MIAKQLYLIDAHALCYRAFYAIKGLSTSKGMPTNAVYGFANTLRKILNDHKPDYLAVCFDSKAKTFRQQKFTDYKIQRPVMPESLIEQMPYIKEVVRGFALRAFEVDGFEADDIIAAIAKRFSSSNMEVVIVSDDKDMFQLVGEHVKILSSRQDKALGPREVEEILGVRPEMVADYLGLVGDTSDNIPGVKGIGPVAAQKLIAQYGKLENIYAQIDSIGLGKVHGVLKEHQDSAKLSKELAILDGNMPLEVKIDELVVTHPDYPKLLELYTILEFHQLASQLAVSMDTHKKTSTAQVLTSTAETSEVVEKIKKSGRLAFYCSLPNSESTDIFVPDLCICTGENAVYSLTGEAAVGLKEIFANEKILKVTADLKEQLLRLDDFGLVVSRGVFDVKLAAYLLAPSRGNFSLETLAWQYLKQALPTTASFNEQTEVILKLADPLAAELKECKLFELFEKIEIPLSLCLFAMEKQGVKLDTDLLEKLNSECEAKIAAVTKELYDLAGESFNLNSPKQLANILFVKLKLPAVKRTKTGFSTNEEVLTSLASCHALPAKILDYRQLAKLKSTYIDALPRMINAKTGRIHASFNQFGTETGRLSSNNPNLQNIPIRTDLGRQIRKAFVAGDQDSFIVSADYSQIELRILAHLSGDENLISAFAAGEDIHNFTAAQVFDIEEGKVTSEMRNTAKRVNFGIIYGMSAFGLAKDLDITAREAEDFIARYFSRYPKVKIFMDEQIRLCQSLGYVTTLLNRRRYIPDINNPNMGIRQFAERQAINTPVQGSAADLIKLAMINVESELRRRKLSSRMIITVHDELVFDVPKKEMDELVAVIRERMENALTLKVPVKVTIKYGKNWLETQKVG